MEVIDGDPAVRVGLVDPVLGGLLLSDAGPILARDEGVGLLAASVSGARGRGAADDFKDDVESGEITELRGTGGDLAVVEDDKPDRAGGAPVPVLAPGTREVLREGADGGGFAPDDGLDGGGIDVR